MLVPILVLYLSPYVMAGLVQPDYDVHNLYLVHDLFEDFKLKFNRTYSPEEEFERFHYFHQNLKQIQQFNKENPLAVHDINKFADWSPEEKKKLLGFELGEDFDLAKCTVGVGPSTRNAPDALDWRDHNAVAPVQNQGNCESCWAFSATGAIEGAYAIKHNQLLKLSEQQLVDCDDQSNGCSGGMPNAAISKLIEEGGQESEDAYPYQGVMGQCTFDQSKVKVQVTGCTLYTDIDEEQLKELLYTSGPLSVGLSGEVLHNYHLGVWKQCDPKDLTHGVVLVGYGEEEGTPFWIIKNSWAADWGENGYVRLQRGNNCAGIGKYTVSAEVA